MAQDRKAVKVKFFFDNGDEVTVLTKNDRERECMTAIARATVCDREKDGDMENVVMAVSRANTSRTSAASTAGFQLFSVVEFVKNTLNALGENERAAFIALLMEELTKFTGGRVIRGEVSADVSEDDVLEALDIALREIGDELKAQTKDQKEPVKSEE